MQTYIIFTNGLNLTIQAASKEEAVEIAKTDYKVNVVGVIQK